MVKYGVLDPRYRDDPASIQRLGERRLDQHQFLHRYDVPAEGQRNKIRAHRQSVLDGAAQCRSELERQITLRVIDDLWADYLIRLEDFRVGIPGQSYAAVSGFFVGVDYRDLHFTFLRQIDEWFPEPEAAWPEHSRRATSTCRTSGQYQTVSQPKSAACIGIARAPRPSLCRHSQSRAIIGQARDPAFG